MTQHNTLKINLSNSQLKKLKSGIKTGTEVTLNILLNVVAESNDENNFTNKLIVTNREFSKLRKAFANALSANIRLLKTRLHKNGQSSRLLGGPLGPWLNIGLPLIGNALKQLAKSVLISLGLTAGASATDAVIHKEMFGSDRLSKVSNGTRPSDLASCKTLIISN